jgi:hypothetical protein
MQEEFDPSLFPSATDMNSANDIWNQGTKDAENDNPVGNMQGIIRKASLGRSAASDRLQISYEIEVLVGPSAGKKLRKYDGLETAQQAKITQQQLARVGIKVEGIQKLPAALLTLIDKPIVFSAKKNGQYYNIYFQRLLTAAPEGGATTPFAAAAATKAPAAKKF